MTDVTITGAGALSGGFVDGVHIPASKSPYGVGDDGYLTGQQIKDALAASTGIFPVFNFVYRLSLGTLLVAGAQDKDITHAGLQSGSLSGLLATDTLMELQVVGDLPANIAMTQQRITGNAALRVRFAAVVALTLNNNDITFKRSEERRVG